MMPDKLHDALNYLDDDLIESADRRRRSTDSKKVLLRIIPAAACLCIILTGILTAQYKGVFTNGPFVSSDKEDREAVQKNESLPPAQEQAPAGNIPIPDNSTHEADDEGDMNAENADGAAPESFPESEELPDFIIKIEKWDGDSIYAVITEHTSTDILPIGTRVKVIFEDQCYICLPDGTGHYTDSLGQPKAQDFPAGTTATVQFYEYEEINGEIILYSGMIRKEI